MDIFRVSQLVIFSHNTTFITFFCKVLDGENWKWPWIFAFDRLTNRSLVVLSDSCWSA